jgi:hypothetical protein
MSSVLVEMSAGLEGTLLRPGVPAASGGTASTDLSGPENDSLLWGFFEAGKSGLARVGVAGGAKGLTSLACKLTAATTTLSAGEEGDMSNGGGVPGGVRGDPNGEASGDVTVLAIVQIFYHKFDPPLKFKEFLS